MTFKKQIKAIAEANQDQAHGILRFEENKRSTEKHDTVSLFNNVWFHTKNKNYPCPLSVFLQARLKEEPKKTQLKAEGVRVEKRTTYTSALAAIWSGCWRYCWSPCQWCYSLFSRARGQSISSLRKRSRARIPGVPRSSESRSHYTRQNTLLQAYQLVLKKFKFKLIGKIQINRERFREYWHVRF